jgi:hypothetical protein
MESSDGRCRCATFASMTQAGVRGGGRRSQAEDTVRSASGWRSQDAVLSVVRWFGSVHDPGAVDAAHRRPVTWAIASNRYRVLKLALLEYLGEGAAGRVGGDGHHRPELDFQRSLSRSASRAFAWASRNWRRGEAQVSIAAIGGRGDRGRCPIAVARQERDERFEAGVPGRHDDWHTPLAFTALMRR